MGYAIAGEAARRGAEVVLVSGPSRLETPAGVRRVDVETALEMREAVFEELPAASIVIKSAAVADFRAAERRDGKIRKQDLPGESDMSLDLVRNPDILSEICQAKGDRVVVGFAAESGDLLEKAREKLARKGCDLLVANDVAGEKVFGSDDNTVVFVWPGGDVEELPPLPKTQVAARLLDCVEKLCGST
jgi:phosphopantothenoylcysteine decarboxylase/phosphopantothenate--cysteine ligase